MVLLFHAMATLNHYSFLPIMHECLNTANRSLDLNMFMVHNDVKQNFSGVTSFRTF
jgi:hypothetical protein